MVDMNLSEEEQVEALKKWWKANGVSAVGGIAIGLAGVFGWQLWNSHQQQIAEQVSMQFEQLNVSVAAGSFEPATKQAEGIITEHQDSTYAVFAALELAKVKVAQGDVVGAQGQLQWVVENAPNPSLAQIARLRIARILLDSGDLDGVSELLKTDSGEGYRGDFSELKGDVALERGDKSSARSLYREALDNQVSNTAVVQMKFDDLAQ